MSNERYHKERREASQRFLDQLTGKVDALKVKIEHNTDKQNDRRKVDRLRMLRGVSDEF